MSNHRDIHFRYLTILLVNYTSIKPGREGENYSFACQFRAGHEGIKANKKNKLNYV